MAIFSHFPLPITSPRIKIVIPEEPGKSHLWGYFDGIKQHKDIMCGGGFILYLYEKHFSNSAWVLGG